MSVIFVYVTASHEEEAVRLGRALVEERLAACINVLGRITSIYRWEKGVTEDSEVALIIKTRAELFDQVAERVRALHSYEVPAILEIPLGRIDTAFHGWLIQETMTEPLGNA